MENNTCPQCGAKMNKYWHNLTRGLVDSFIKFSLAVRSKNANSVHLQTDVQLTKNQYNNFQKLRFFGLVAKVKDKNGNRKAGYWLVTKNGGAFLRGELAMPRRVRTFRNKIIDKDENLVYIKEVMGDDSVEYYQRIFK